MPTDPALDADQRPNPKQFHLDRRAADLTEKGAAAGSPDDLLSTSEVAEWLGISTQWLEIGRHRGYGPKFCRLSPRRIRYVRSSVLRFLAEREHASTAEYDTGRKRQEAGDEAA